MLLTYKRKLESAISAISAFSQKYSVLVVTITCLLSIVCLALIAMNFAINTSTEDMLSEELPWRAAYIDYVNNFPEFSDNIVIVVDAVNRDIAEDVARELSDNVLRDKEHFHGVNHLYEHPFIRQQQLMYLSTDDLFDLVDRLSDAQPFIAQLTVDPSTARLFEMLNSAYSSDTGTPLPGLNRISEQVANAIENTADNVFLPMSWVDSLYPGKLRTRIVFTTRPKLDYSNVLAAEDAVQQLNEYITGIQEEYPNLVSIRMTGDAALAYDEMQSLTRGSTITGILAFILVMTCLFLGLRSWGLIVCSVVTLLAGLIFTACFAVMAVGTLNMISIAFAVLYVGLGVDFAIHTCLKYSEMLGKVEGTTKHQIINSSLTHVGPSITLCALTTSIGFFAFFPTEFQGVAELGVIAGVGMFISLVTTTLLLPALLELLPAPTLPDNDNKWLLPDSWHGNKLAVSVLFISSIICIGALFYLNKISFDIDPLNVNDQQADSVKLFRDLSNDKDYTPYSLSIMAENQRELKTFTEKLGKLDSIARFSSINSLIPDRQSEKLDIIDELNLILGNDLSVAENHPINYEKTLEQLKSLQSTLLSLDTSDTPSELINAIDIFIEKLHSVNQDSKEQSIVLLNKNLMHGFASRMERIADGLNASAINFDSLPEQIKRQWISPDGLYRIEVTPTGDLSNNDAQRSFVGDIQNIAGDKVSGVALINIGAADAVQNAFKHALTYAFVLITLILILSLRSIREVLVTLCPLLMAALSTCFIMVLFGIPFNFANVIALPLLLGIGVDSAIHLLLQHKSNQIENVLHSSTAKAVFFSAATTTMSFGSLAMSEHTGTASMGIVLTIGIVCVLISMLVVLPALLHLFIKREISS